MLAPHRPEPQDYMASAALAEHKTRVAEGDKKHDPVKLLDRAGRAKFDQAMLDFNAQVKQREKDLQHPTDRHKWNG